VIIKRSQEWTCAEALEKNHLEKSKKPGDTRYKKGLLFSSPLVLLVLLLGEWVPMLFGLVLAVTGFAVAGFFKFFSTSCITTLDLLQ